MKDMKMNDLDLDVELTESDLTSMETVEVEGDLDTWMNDMLSGPSEYDY